MTITISTNAAALANTTLATRAIHAGQEPDPTTGAVVTPIYMTSTFKQDGVGGLRNGYDYSRSVNPTRNSFDAQLAAVEGAKYALSFSSGLAAIDVLLRAPLKPGDNILLSGWNLNDPCEVWLEALTRTGQGHRIDILPTPPATLAPEIFPDRHWLLVTRGKLTAARKKQIEQWQQQVSLEVIIL